MLQLDPSDSDKITGTVSDGDFTADLTANRAVFDGRQQTAPQEGVLMFIAGSDDSSVAPGGDSVATVQATRQAISAWRVHWQTERRSARRPQCLKMRGLYMLTFTGRDPSWDGSPSQGQPQRTSVAMSLGLNPVSRQPGFIQPDLC
jgi:hypothetical protein